MKNFFKACWTFLFGGDFGYTIPEIKRYFKGDVWSIKALQELRFPLAKVTNMPPARIHVVPELLSVLHRHNLIEVPDITFAEIVALVDKRASFCEDKWSFKCSDEVLAKYGQYSTRPGWHVVRNNVEVVKNPLQSNESLVRLSLIPLHDVQNPANALWFLLLGMTWETTSVIVAPSENAESVLKINTVLQDGKLRGYTIEMLTASPETMETTWFLGLQARNVYELLLEHETRTV